MSLCPDSDGNRRDRTGRQQLFQLQSRWVAFAGIYRAGIIRFAPLLHDNVLSEQFEPDASDSGRQFSLWVSDFLHRLSELEGDRGKFASWRQRRIIIFYIHIHKFSLLLSKELKCGQKVESALNLQPTTTFSSKSPTKTQSPPSKKKWHLVMNLIQIEI